MSETLDRDQLLKLTLEVVEAYVSSHRVAPTELEVIIGSVAGSLAEVGDPPQAVPAKITSSAWCAARSKRRSNAISPCATSSLQTNTGNVSACTPSTRWWRRAMRRSVPSWLGGPGWGGSSPPPHLLQRHASDGREQGDQDQS
jgi:hypothetical protein